MRLDSDSGGTILLVWCLCAAAVFLALHFISPKWISLTLTGVAVFFAAFVTWFFRVPDREPLQGSPNAVTAIADGKIVIVEKVFEEEYLHRECIQVSTYMNFFDVHANFWPVTGSVTYYKYHPGKNLLAFRPKSSQLNEHASSALQCGGQEIFFKQIAGTFARRIVCYSVPGLATRRGTQCGVIKFGSRIDLFLPLDADIKVKAGDKVKAVSSVIAELKLQQSTDFQ